MTTQNDKETLIGLLDKFNTIIPIIQRDYAQGRDNEHATLVRKKLLEDMRSALENDNDLDLNFIYGKIDESQTTFYPVDGQQRLTTLFLFHWYIFTTLERRSKNKFYEIRSLLKKFSYQARFTSKDFFKELNSHIDDFNNDDNKIEETIENSAWFDEIWKFDPTVKGVLQTLSDIQEVMKGVTEEQKLKLFDKQECKITFLSKCMEELGKPDALYIKLNARGRQLTYLELFKVKVFNCISKLAPEIAVKFKLNFDGEWTDLCWDFVHSKKKIELFDSLFLNIFGTIFVNCLVKNKIKPFEEKETKNKNKDKDKKIEKPLEQTKSPQEFVKQYHLWQNYFDYDFEKEQDETVIKLRPIMETFLNDSYMVLNSLKEKEIKEIILNIYYKDKEKNKEQSFTYDDMAEVYAITQYIVKNQGKIDTDNFKEFYRVFKNLLTNSVGADRIDKVDKLYKAFVSIDTLVKNSGDILNYLSNDNKRLVGFSENQMKEERIKAKIINSNSQKYKDIIIEAEKPPFNGQIGSVLYLSNSDTNFDDKTFNEYFEKVKVIFELIALPDHKSTQYVRRALLAIEDYSDKDKKDYLTLCPDDVFEAHKTISLKRFFREHYETVKPLVDSINLSVDIKTQLIAKIEQEKSQINDWRFWFIDEPKMFEDSSQLRLYFKDKKVYMLSGIKKSTTDQDVVLKYIYMKLQNDGYKKDQTVRFAAQDKECELTCNGYQIEHDGENILVKKGTIVKTVKVEKNCYQQVLEIIKS